MNQVEVKFGEWIEQGFNLYKENFGVLVLSSLIALFLGGFTFLVLAGPLMAGVIIITLALFDKREPKPQVGEVFQGFSYFLQAFLFVFVWFLALFVASFILAFIPCVGQLVSLVLIYVLQAALMFGLFLIVDQQMDFWPASMASFEKVKANFLPFLGFFVVTSIIGSIGAIACGIGMVFTFPIQTCILTVAYRDVFSGVQPSKGAADKPSEPAEKINDTADKPFAGDKI
jgi:uncharacterized membrane protein